MQQLKLFMVLLGCTPPGRHVEQHDVFFGIAASIQDLFPEFKAFWPEGKVHVDAWREVTSVEGHEVKVVANDNTINEAGDSKKLFFVNLGGYLENRFEEQHYIVLTVKETKSEAFREAKATLFYQHNQFGNGAAVSHIDDKYGVDVDDLYQIEDILSPAQKEKYRLVMIPDAGLPEDAFHLGYLKLPA